MEIKIETIGDRPEVLALPSIRCVGNVPTELSVGTEDSGYLIKAQVLQTETEKKVYTSINLKRNGEVVDISEHEVKFTQ